MEVLPYTVQAREDTGLYNAKVGIWLFLASEVMLFGALFSSYILLRVGAAPGTWPHGLLNVPIGTFNTAVLIISSMTVVMAWASLKMNRFGRFKVFEGLTVVCALSFLGIKSFEYHDKFTHYDVRFAKSEPATKILQEAYGENYLEVSRALWKKTFGDVTPAGPLEKSEAKDLRLTGHLEGNPMFLTREKLLGQKKEQVTFIPDPPPHSHEHPHAIKIDLSQVSRLSAYVPSHSTYFAIYFTLTALHALHVFGGAVVIGFLFGPGSKMWRTQPDRLTNRVEVSGLFWHFVDLVWIFLFPVLYLL
jgi:cytochrome c oxidase subunit III